MFKFKNLIMCVLALLLCFSALASCTQGDAHTGDQNSGDQNTGETTAASKDPTPNDTSDAGEEITDGIFKFISNGDGTCSVSAGVDFNEVDLVIPEVSPAGDVVVEIPYSGFYNKNSIKTVKIPSSLKLIGETAFWDCKNLTNVEIADGVEIIDSYAFSGCTELSKITVPDTVREVSRSSFENCEKLQYAKYENALYVGNEGNPYVCLVAAESKDVAEIKINPSTKVVAGYGLEGCAKLTSIDIPDSVTEIGAYAFADCVALDTVTMSDSVKSIGDWAFGGCSSLTSVELSNGLESFGDSVFANCEKLTYTVFENAKYVGSTENPYIVLVKRTFFTDKNTIHGSTKFISNYAFNNLGGLTKIVIPDGVLSIGTGAFENCSDLSEITLPDSIKEIKSKAFDWCAALKTVYFAGTEEEWNAITIDSTGNDPLISAEKIYSVTEVK